MSSPLDKLRDDMLAAPDMIEEGSLPPRFSEARSILQHALKEIDNAGVPAETVITVMLSEMLPRMVHLHGPAWSSRMLGKLASSIDGGETPVPRVQ